MRIHIALTTRDLGAAESFYSALFGVEPDKVRDNYRRYQPDGAPIVLTLMPGEPGTKGAVDHFGLRFADVAATKSAWERASKAGLDPRTELDVTCCWAVQNKAWVSDPDGREWELYTVTNDSPVIENDQPSPCCA